MDTLELRLSIGKQMMIAHLILQYIPATALGVAGIAFQCNPVLQVGLRLIKASHASAVLHSGAAILFEIRAIAHWARAPRNAKEIATRSSSVLLVTAAASLPVFDNVDNLVHVAGFAVLAGVFHILELLLFLMYVFVRELVNVFALLVPWYCATA